MVIDKLSNADKYIGLNTGIAKAFEYLLNNDFSFIAPGKYAIEGDQIFSIVQEYETISSVNEKMESHEKYIDVQYMIEGSEQVGLALYSNQTIYSPYDAEKDFMLYSEQPEFFGELKKGMFMIFFPTDLHMPCIQNDKPQLVIKVVVKVRLDI